MIFIIYLLSSAFFIFAAVCVARLGLSLAKSSKLKHSAMTVWLMCASVFHPESTTAYHEVEREKEKPDVNEDNRKI
jgi:hypothetical protein